MAAEKSELVGLNNKLKNRSVNEGFSGGEKKEMRFFKWQCSILNYQF